jgi:hypothetical protein
MLVALFLATAIIGPAAAQRPEDDNARGGVRTETMSRIAGGDDLEFVFNVIGLFGLLGLFGIQGEHSDDSYHPAGIE